MIGEMPIKRITLILFTVLMLVRLSAAGEVEGQRDLAKLQGKWNMVSGTRDGASLSDEMLKTGTRVCKGNEVVVHVGGMLLMKAAFTLDATKSPKTIDYNVTEGPNAGKKQLGIYKFDGDTVQFCFAGVDQPRPDAFESKTGDGRTLSAWKRTADPQRAQEP